MPQKKQHEKMIILLIIIDTKLSSIIYFDKLIDCNTDASGA